MKQVLLAAVLAGALGSMGCATIMDGKTQAVSITAMRDGHVVTNQTTCTASNKKGAWVARNGNLVVVQKSRDDLIST